MSAMKNGKIAPGPGKKYAPQSNGVDKIQNNSGTFSLFIPKHLFIYIFRENF